MLTFLFPRGMQLAEREAAVADLEAQQVELAAQQAACDALGAQLRQQSEAVAAEAQSAHDAAQVRVAAAAAAMPSVT